MMSMFRSLLVVIGAVTLAWMAVKEIDAVLFAQWGFGRDATDGTERSGLALRTDAGTGCQYLLSPWGGVTPRLDNTGGHICGGRQ
jgi:hypothetical protein